MSKVAEQNPPVKEPNVVTDLVPRPSGGSLALDIADFSERMEFEKQRLSMMREFVQSQMKEGVHYGKIPGTPGKRTLFKPGAELLTNIHGQHPEFEETERVCDRDAVKHYSYERFDRQQKKRVHVEGDCRGYVKYSFRCSLIKDGAKVGEGVGTCNSWEKKYLTVDSDDSENTIMKMAKKRAFVDAVLTATRTSDFFTQDLEDREENGGHQTVQTPRRASEPQSDPGQAPAEAEVWTGLIATITKKKTGTKKDGTPWSLYYISGGDGTEFRTFEEPHVQFAREAGKLPVRIQFSSGERGGKMILSIEPGQISEREPGEDSE